jgi:hypothetical protein
MIMRIHLSIAAIALAATTTAGSAEPAKRRPSPSYLTTSAATNSGNDRSAQAASAYDADPARRNGNYPAWALQAFAGRGTGK